MKRIEIDTLLPSKSRWEFVIIPSISFGYYSESYFGYGPKRYFIYFSWLLWNTMIMIKKK